MNVHSVFGLLLSSLGVVIAWESLLPPLVALLVDCATGEETCDAAVHLLNLWRVTEHPGVEVDEHISLLTHAFEQRPSELLDEAVCILSNQSYVSWLQSRRSTASMVHHSPSTVGIGVVVVCRWWLGVCVSRGLRNAVGLTSGGARGFRSNEDIPHYSRAGLIHRLRCAGGDDRPTGAHGAFT